MNNRTTTVKSPTVELREVIEMYKKVTALMSEYIEVRAYQCEDKYALRTIELANEYFQKYGKENEGV